MAAVGQYYRHPVRPAFSRHIPCGCRHELFTSLEISQTRMRVLCTWKEMIIAYLVVLLVLLAETNQSSRCEALGFQAHLLPAANDTTTTSASQHSSAVESLATSMPQYPGPFKVTAKLHPLSETDYDQCKLADIDGQMPAQPYITLTSQRRQSQHQSSDSSRECLMWISSCELEQGCVGAVYLLDVTTNMADFLTHTMRNNPSLNIPFPVVALAGGGDAEDWLTEHINTGNVEVTISSGDPNSFAQVFQSIPWKLWASFSALHSFGNVVGVCSKLALFLITAPSADDPIPKTVPFVLVPEMIANIMRCLLLLDMAFFEMLLLPYDVMRLLMTVPLTLGMASTLAISAVVYNIHRNAFGGEGASDGSTSHRCSWILILLMSMMIALDLVFTVFQRIVKVEMINSALVGAFYTVVQVPIALGFIRFGGSTSKRLLSLKDSLTAEEIKKRDRFARNVKFSGVAMILATISGAVFVTVGPTSTAAWLYSFTASHLALNITGSFQIAAVRTPARAGDSARVHPSAGYAGTTSNKITAGMSTSSAVRSRSRPPR